MASSVCLLFRVSLACVALVACLCAALPTSDAPPPWLAPGTGVFTPSAECHTDDELLDLCQRCAKLTKSGRALPACCSEDMGARRWCSDYVYFGRGHFDNH